MRHRWSVARRAGKQWQASLFLMLHFLQVSPHTANATCCLWRACTNLSVCVPARVCRSVQGPGMQRWLNPRLSKKHAWLPIPMTLNTHMAVLGKTNGRKMEYTSTAGTEKKEEEGRDATHSVEQPAKFLWVMVKDAFFFFFREIFASVSVCWYVRLSVILPANHLWVVVHWDVGSDAVIVGAKVAVWSAKPFIKTVL